MTSPAKTGQGVGMEGLWRKARAQKMTFEEFRVELSILHGLAVPEPPVSLWRRLTRFFSTTPRVSP